MRILFTTQQRSAVSTVINLKNFSRLAEIAGVHFSAFSDDFASYDVIMFMGYDPQIAEARKMAPHAKIGIVDPRPGTLAACRGADFVIANGPEMTAMASRYVSNIFEYPIYPEVPEVARSDKSNAQVTLTYHGNRAHAVAMFPQVTRALEEVARLVPIRLQIIYNVDQLAPIPERYLPRSPVEVNVINWHESIYSKELAEADVGLVPNLTPMHSVETALALTTPRDNAFGADPSEILTRYKATSNPGRILSFAQHGVPVIADTFPSASQIIRNGETGFLAFDAFSWYQALRTLCLDEDLRRRMGNNLQAVFRAQFRITDLNQRLVDFLRSQPAVHEPPEILATAQELFETTDVRSSPPSWRSWLVRCYSGSIAPYEARAASKLGSFMLSRLNSLFGRPMAPSERSVIAFRQAVASLRPGDIAIDCGANVGRFTGEMAGTGADVHAFEPNPAAFAKLQAALGKKPNVTLYQKAVAAEPGEVRLYLHEHADKDPVTWSTGSSLLAYKSNVNPDTSVAVEAVDLVAFISALPGRVSLLKIDIEGAEVALLNRLIDASLHNRIKSIFVETHDHKIPELRASTEALRQRIAKLGIRNINLDWE